jgi:hypothetical protein
MHLEENDVERKAKFILELGGSLTWKETLQDAQQYVKSKEYCYDKAIIGYYDFFLEMTRWCILLVL